MSSFLNLNNSIRRQNGAALVVSLVILAVVTVMGVAGLQSTQLEMKMAASARDRSETFAAVEATLAMVESELVEEPPHLTQFFEGCAGTGKSTADSCFTETCTNGRCFGGVVTAKSSECKVSKYDKGDAGAKGTDFWKDETVWETNGRHDRKFLSKSGVQDSKTGDSIEVKYIIEFMCYTGIDGAPSGGVDARVGIESEDTNAGRELPLFRVTARAEGLANRAEVTLQSVVRVVDNF